MTNRVGLWKMTTALLRVLQNPKCHSSMTISYFLLARSHSHNLLILLVSLSCASLASCLTQHSKVCVIHDSSSQENSLLLDWLFLRVLLLLVTLNRIKHIL